MSLTQPRPLAAALFALITLVAAGSAGAHSDDYLDTQTTPHGGQLRMAGAYHLELVLIKDSKAPKDNPVVVHVTDHAGAKVLTAGAKASVILLYGKTKASVELLPAGDNRLQGSAVYASTPDLKAVVSLTLAGQAPEQARFTPLAAKGKAADAHTGHAH